MKTVICKKWQFRKKKVQPLLASINIPNMYDIFGHITFYRLLFSTFLPLLFGMLVWSGLNRNGNLCLVRLLKTPNKDIKAAVAE